MICFHFRIFVVLETTRRQAGGAKAPLWFAFILLSLSYWKQRRVGRHEPCTGCDLLSFYYLCRTGNNGAFAWVLSRNVVICFHFTIFVVLETTLPWNLVKVHPLWFAFILLSLSYWKQPFKNKRLWLFSCDLLSFYYLCRTGNNEAPRARRPPRVVICFHFTIFVVLETTVVRATSTDLPLWFAFILLSLSYWKQPQRKEKKTMSVVICFHPDFDSLRIQWL